MKVDYLSAADTAKLVRAALKRSFPDTCFSVRSKTYSGGASINVSWTDGPACKLVERIAGQFAGGRFDGMIDIKIGVKHWLLPDGTTAVASNPGTEGSMGVLPAEREWMPQPGARLVHFCADFVFCTRHTSPALVGRVLARLKAQGVPVELLRCGPATMDAAISPPALTPLTRSCGSGRRASRSTASWRCERHRTLHTGRGEVHSGQIIGNWVSAE